jgi:hypothetical protein
MPNAASTALAACGPPMPMRCVSAETSGDRRLGTQHVHSQPLRDGIRDVGSEQHPEAIRRAPPQDEVREHAPLRRVEAAIAAGSGVHCQDVARKLALQERSGVGAVDREDCEARERASHGSVARRCERRVRVLRVEERAIGHAALPRRFDRGCFTC